MRDNAIQLVCNYLCNEDVSNRMGFSLPNPSRNKIGDDSVSCIPKDGLRTIVGT